MKILVLQHADVEHPGIFRNFLKDDGLFWDTAELDAGEPIPDLDPYDLLIVMGGPQDVWQEQEHPWLKTEKQAIRRFAVDMKRPVLGICLGHQLLAEAIGGAVGPAKTPEVGVMTIEKTGSGEADPLLAGLPGTMTVLQWHCAEVTSLPQEAVVIASSEACPVQAFRYGRHAYGLQYHVEITEETVNDWAGIAAYACALDNAMGEGAVTALDKTVRQRLPAFNRDARIIYDNFMQIIRRPA